MKHIISLIFFLTLITGGLTSAQDSDYSPVLIEEFDNNDNQWEVFENDSQLVRIEDSRLIIANFSQSDFLYTALPYELSLPGNHQFIVSLRYLDGDSSSSFGVAWGKHENGQYNQYFIGFTASGYYSLFHVAEEWNTITDWTLLPKPLSSNEFNEVVISREGKSYTIQLGDAVLGTVDYIEGFGSAFGFVAAPNVGFDAGDLFVFTQGAGN